MSVYNTYYPRCIEFTFSCDASALADNDIAADFQEVTGFFSKAGETATIHSLTLIDETDQGVELDILCSRTGGTLGSENGAINISDANADEVQRVAAIATADYVDLINSQIATKTNLGVVVGGGASTSLWFGLIVRSGTPTFTATSVKVKMYVTQH